MTDMQQEGEVRRAPTATCISSPYARASLHGDPSGRVHCAVGSCGGVSPQVPLELMCWEGSEAFARARVCVRVNMKIFILGIALATTLGCLATHGGSAQWCALGLVLVQIKTVHGR